MVLFRAWRSREEKAHERVAGDYASEKKLSLLTVMQKKERKIALLSLTGLRISGR